MRLTLLGTGTCYPTMKRAPACYFLSIGPLRLVIDPGPGAVARIAQAGLDPFGVEAIFISHHHPDHCADLVPFLFSYKNCVSSGSRRDIRIFAPKGFTQVFDHLTAAFGQWIMDDDYSVLIDEMRQDKWEIAGLKVRSAPMLHGANAVGYRFEQDGGPVLAYSGDTGPCDELAELASGADALLVECSFPDGEGMEGHMQPSQVARAGIRSGVKKLILTHFYPSVDTDRVGDIVASAGYEGEIIIGHDGMSVTL